MKRAVTNVGDIFATKRGEYIQLVAIDKLQLDGDVVVYYGETELSRIPNVPIVFYFHSTLSQGVEMGLWKKVGNRPLPDLSKLVFKDYFSEDELSVDGPFLFFFKRKPYWNIWTPVSSRRERVGHNEGILLEAEDGGVGPAKQLYDRIMKSRDEYLKMYKEYWPGKSDLRQKKANPWFHKKQKLVPDSPCEICTYNTFFSDERGRFFICPVCFWEDDEFHDNPDEPCGGPNYNLSVNQAKQNYQSFGACTKDVIEFVRNPLPEEIPNSAIKLHPTNENTTNYKHEYYIENVLATGRIEELIKNIKVEDFVKVVLKINQPVKGIDAERLWFRVIDIIDTSSILVELSNDPIYLRSIKDGDRITVTKQNVLEVMK
jgi:hypothetical protein